LTKKFIVLVVMLATLLTAAVPALAQEGVSPDEPADGPPGPSPDTAATLTFELTVKGTPPEGTTFLGFIPAEGGISVPLADPDGDGVYTGGTSLDRFGPGPRPVPPGTEPVSLPVQIVQENGGNIEVIRDFGVVPLDGDKTFSAKVNFKRDREDTEAGSSTPNPDGTGGANEAAGPQTGEDVNEDGLINETDGEVAAAVSDAAIDAAKSSSEPTLPATGGPVFLTLFVPGLAGLTVAISGLLARHAMR
jgi:hypothetical protein